MRGPWEHLRLSLKDGDLVQWRQLDQQRALVVSQFTTLLPQLQLFANHLAWTQLLWCSSLVKLYLRTIFESERINAWFVSFMFYCRFNLLDLIDFCLRYLTQQLKPSRCALESYWIMRGLSYVLRAMCVCHLFDFFVNVEVLLRVIIIDIVDFAGISLLNWRVCLKSLLRIISINCW